MSSRLGLELPDQISVVSRPRNELGSQRAIDAFNGVNGILSGDPWLRVEVTVANGERATVIPDRNASVEQTRTDACRGRFWFTGSRITRDAVSKVSRWFLRHRCRKREVGRISRNGPPSHVRKPAVRSAPRRDPEPTLCATTGAGSRCRPRRPGRRPTASGARMRVDAAASRRRSRPPAVCSAPSF